MARFNKATGKSKRYYEKKGGLIDNTVNAIVPDDDGYLWISTKMAFADLTPSQKPFWTITTQKMDYRAMNFYSCADKRHNGTIYLVVAMGLALLNLKIFSRTPTRP